ncbi:MAG: hypothetical protein OYH77_06185 [Pseudomonadota bacterium]|nr:hypothetical protein [Pseudomonadota bacterium]
MGKKNSGLLSKWQKKSQTTQEETNSDNEKKALNFNPDDNSDKPSPKLEKLPNKFELVKRSEPPSTFGKHSNAAEIERLLGSKTRAKKKRLQYKTKQRKKRIAQLKTAIKILLLLCVVYASMAWWQRQQFDFANSSPQQLLQTVYETAKDELRKVNRASDQALDADAWTHPNLPANTYKQATDHGEMDCLDILGVEKPAEVGSKLIFAECAYVNGDVNRSYEVLDAQAATLQQESLLLYVMLLLKRHEFGEAAKFLHGKCRRQASSSAMFFPCLADALYQTTVNGYSNTQTIAPKDEHSRNPYAALYWLVEFLKTGSTDISNNSIQDAIAIASAAKRPAALVYIYEALASHIYLKGSQASMRQLTSQAQRTPRMGGTVALQWVGALAQAKPAKFGVGKAYRLVATITSGYLKLCDNMNFLTPIAYTGVRDGRIRDVLEELRRVQDCYQGRNWRNRSGLQTIDAWKIRIEIAQDKYRQAAKLLRKYRSNYGENVFYYHYTGALQLKIFRHKAKFKTVANNFNKSLLARESWESNYCMAVLHAYMKKYVSTHEYITTIQSKYQQSEYSSWLFMLENETLIARGKLDKAISNLTTHLRTNHSAFRAYELLIRAYRRQNKHAKALELQKIFNKVIKTIPYYSTDEGAASPMGALALI